LGQKESGVFRRGTIHMKYSLPGQEKDDLLIQVIVWTDLTVKCIKKW